MSKISFRSVLAGLSAASLLLPSCTENLEVSLPGVVSLKAGHIATRAVTDPNTMEATFAEGDKVKITSVGLYSDMSDETFTVGADGMLSSSSTFNYKEGTKTITFAEIEEAFGSDLSSLTAPLRSLITRLCYERPIFCIFPNSHLTYDIALC